MNFYGTAHISSETKPGTRTILMGIIEQCFLFVPEFEGHDYDV